MAELRYLSDVVRLEIFIEKCTGCGMCAEVCPRGVFVIEDKKAVIVDIDACIECGACALNCRYEALVVEKGVGCAASFINDMMKGTLISGISPQHDCSNNSSCC